MMLVPALPASILMCPVVSNARMRQVHMYTDMVLPCLYVLEYVGCPLMSNETIVQQPVDLTTLSENIASAAVDFVYNASGLNIMILISY